MKKRSMLFHISAAVALAALVVHILSYFIFLRGVQFALWPPAFFLFALVVRRFVRMRKLPQRLPFSRKWLTALLIACALYTAFNFAVNSAALYAGSGEIVGGRYCLVCKGSIKAEIGYAEYRRLVLAEQRLASGHVLPFLAVSLGVFAGPETEKSRDRTI